MTFWLLVSKRYVEQIQQIFFQVKISDVIHASVRTSRIRVEALLGVYRRVPLVLLSLIQLDTL